MRAAPMRIGAALVCAALLTIAGVAGAAPVAVVSAMKGKVEVTLAGGKTVRAVRGQHLQNGDKVSVAHGGKLTLQFSNHKKIELGGGSVLTIGSTKDAHVTGGSV